MEVSTSSSPADDLPVAERAVPDYPHDAPAPRRTNRFVAAWRRIGGGSLALSLLIHAGILIAAGLVVFTTTLRDPQVDFLPGGGTQQGQQASNELAHQVQQKKRSILKREMPKQRIVSTSQTAAISLPDAPLDLLDMPDVSSMFGGGKMGSGGFGTGGSGGGFGNGSGLGGLSGRTFAPLMMFGKEIRDARRIAVVMDVSRSMTRYLPAVARELDKLARQSVLVLYFGCGLTEPKEDKLDDKVRRTSDEEAFAAFWQYWQGRGPMNLTVEERRKLKYDKSQPMPLEDLYKKMYTRPATYFINFNGIRHAQSALMCNEVMEADAIYWFADFQDAVSEETMEKVRRKLKTRKQKLYIHASTRGRSFEEVSEGLVKPLGGEVIEAEVSAK